MKIEKVTPKIQKTVVLTLTEEEAKILSALANFPRYAKQPAATTAFCRDLRSRMESAGGVYGYTDDYFKAGDSLSSSSSW